MSTLYAGINAADRHRLPPSLIMELWQGECELCGRAVACHGPTLRRYRHNCDRRGVELIVVCPSCCERTLAERGGIEVMSVTPDVSRHFNRG